MNAYLIKQDPITLIDCGVYGFNSKLALVEQLCQQGLELKDIRRILITHAHPDHYGLAAEIQRISGASVYMHPREAIKARGHLKNLQRIASFAVFAGLPEEFHIPLEEHNKWEASFVQPPAEIVEIDNGHIFLFEGGEIEGVLTPGHAVGHMSYYQKEGGLLFSGDTVLGKIIPNPVLEPSPDGKLDREKSLIQYINSINALRKLKINQILPGHGSPIPDPLSAFKRVDILYQERKAEVKKIAYLRGDFNLFEVAIELYRNIKRPVDYYLAMSEMLGYLDILEAEGTVIQQQTPAGITYTYSINSQNHIEIVQS